MPPSPKEKAYITKKTVSGETVFNHNYSLFIFHFVRASEIGHLTFFVISAILKPY